jgi:hypothetical protein
VGQPAIPGGLNGAIYRFAVGQDVMLVPEPSEDRSSGGLYKIVRLLPEQGPMPQYRVKAYVDGRE